VSIEIHNTTGEPIMVIRRGRTSAGTLVQEEPKEINHEEKLVLDGYDPSACEYVIRPSRDSGTLRDWRPKLRDEPDREDD
jgi:hypothetical protein